MIINEQQVWIDNIESLTSSILTQLDPAVIESVYERHGAHGPYKLSVNELMDVYNELHAIEADSK